MLGVYVTVPATLVYVVIVALPFKIRGSCLPGVAVDVVGSTYNEPLDYVSVGKNLMHVN